LSCLYYAAEGSGNAKIFSSISKGYNLLRIITADNSQEIPLCQANFDGNLYRFNQRQERLLLKGMESIWGVLSFQEF
jgi:hypothetical protein